MECDDATEYKKVRESFYPRLLELEADAGADNGAASR